MSRVEKAAVLAGALIFLAGLALFAYAGFFTRFWADDYCYSAVAGQNGLLRGLVDWYRHSGNRFSALIPVAALDLLGPHGVALLPLLLLALWVFAWLFFLTRLFRHLLHWQVDRLWLLFFGLVQVFFVALLAPDRLQTIYWRMGILHYSLPMPLLLIILGWTAENLSLRLKPWLLAASAAVAFFAAGLSETYAMLQLGVFGLGLLPALALLRGDRRMRAAAWLGVPLLTTLGAIGLMFLSPSLPNRLAVMPAPANLWLVVPYTLRYVSDFIFYSIRGQFIPYMLYVLMIAALSLAAFRSSDRLAGLRQGAALLGLFLSLVVAFVLIAFTFTPSAYANLQYPAGRALMPASFTLLAGLAGAAFFFSALADHVLSSWLRPDWFSLAALLLILGASLYPLRAARIPLSDLRQQSVWAARWDARDAQIRQDRSAGRIDLVVKQVEVVRTLEDLGPDPQHWINNCASIYYGVRTITALP